MQVPLWRLLTEASNQWEQIMDRDDRERLAELEVEFEAEKRKKAEAMAACNAAADRMAELWQGIRRELPYHQIDGHEDGLTAIACDGPGAGGACHLYIIHRTGLPTLTRHDVDAMQDDEVTTAIDFQDGPIAEVGLNGITPETVLAVLIDHVGGFQGGEFPCACNEDALQYLRGALLSLKNRTRDRIARHVEGRSLR